MITLVEYKKRFWCIGEVFKNGNKIADINKFYDVTKDWITIYDTAGNDASGFSKGNVINKISYLLFDAVPMCFHIISLGNTITIASLEKCNI